MLFQALTPPYQVVSTLNLMAVGFRLGTQSQRLCLTAGEYQTLRTELQTLSNKIRESLFIIFTPSIFVILKFFCSDAKKHLTNHQL